jgi:Tfp pilus assembly protein PilV
MDLAQIRSERGALLMECLVAVMVLGVAVTMLFNLIAVGYLARSLARDQQTATALAQQRLESVLDAGPQAIRSEPRSLVDDAIHHRFEWEVDVVERPPKLKEVTAIVYWTSRGRERSVRLATYLRSP